MFWRGNKEQQPPGASGEGGAGAPLYETITAPEDSHVDKYFREFITTNDRIKKYKLLHDASNNESVRQLLVNYIQLENGKRAKQIITLLLPQKDNEVIQKMLLLDYFLSRFLQLENSIRKKPLEHLKHFVDFLEFLSSDPNYTKLLIFPPAIVAICEILNLFPKNYRLSDMFKGQDYISQLGLIQELLKQNKI